MSDEIKEILREMKEMCEIWVKVDGNMKSYNQDQIHCIYDYITNLQEENEDLREENKEAHDFDETMKDIKENLIARIDRQEKEIENLKNIISSVKKDFLNANSEALELEERIDRAIAYIECGKTFDDIETARIIDKYEKTLLGILQGGDK